MTGSAEVNPLGGSPSKGEVKQTDHFASSHLNLKELVRTLGKILNLNLPELPTFHSVAEIKIFCGGFGENSPVQSWTRRKLRYHVSREHPPCKGTYKGVRPESAHSLKRGGLCRSRDYLTLSHSLFLFRKTLPTPPPDLSAYHNKFAQEKLADPEFVAFVKERIPDMFKPGWDRGYSERVRKVIVGNKSFLEKEKGSTDTARKFVRREIGREKFMELCRTGKTIDFNRRISVVFENGKARIVTIASAYQWCLSPLSGMIYDHISRKSWLLRGDAKSTMFKDFTQKEGELFVSGDYESATDNFNIHHSRAILQAILDTTCLEEGVKKMAMNSLVAIVRSKGLSTFMLAGQLMGDKLS
jgi:hypothetical protein